MSTPQVNGRQAAIEQRCAHETLAGAVAVLRQSGVGAVPLLSAVCQLAGALTAEIAAPGYQMAMLEEAAAIMRTGMIAALPVAGTA